MCIRDRHPLFLAWLHLSKIEDFKYWPESTAHYLNEESSNDNFNSYSRVDNEYIANYIHLNMWLDCQLKQHKPPAFLLLLSPSSEYGQVVVCKNMSIHLETIHEHIPELILESKQRESLKGFSFENLYNIVFYFWIVFKWDGANWCESIKSITISSYFKDV